MLSLHIARGRSLPLGAIGTPEGVNFVVQSRHATAVILVLYPLAGDDRPMTEIVLHPRRNRTGDHWHILVGGLPASFRYGWRVEGPSGPGHCFDPNVVLIDPASTALCSGGVWGQARESDPKTTSRRSVYVRRPFNWQEDAPPLVPLEDSIIYELHVRGFTVHPTAGVSSPGTFAGLIEKVPYLKELGVTAVELLPIHEFDEDDCPFFDPANGERHRNYWGYNSIAFAAPKAGFAASGPDNGQVSEFRELVRALHAAGIEVILDVVFNHTGEGDHRGRKLSFRALDNSLYYMLSPDGRYLNFSGCGNTVNCNHPVVRSLILNCLHFWVADMHVDGLRFDLASVMGRDYNGHVLMDPPVVEMISEDGLLRDTKLIAEPWDAAGLYQVGGFPGRRWTEWNGKYRDDVRRFWRGEPGMTADLATRFCGSADLYEPSGRHPRHSLNFITCHDGFTLNDLVSYSHKHNRANGEGNRDGCNDNHSWNCGAEGPSHSRGVMELRRRQVRNLMATLMLSQGVPMILAGDEFLRTQHGNNNAWCQDNEISWIDWGLAEENGDFLRFTREMIALRKRHPALRRTRFFEGRGGRPYHAPDIVWHGIEPGRPDFSGQSRTLALTIDGQQTGREPDNDIYIAFNAWEKPLTFTIPRTPNGGVWRRVVDTARPTPDEFVDEGKGPEVSAFEGYRVAPFSLIVLITEAI